ncbi:MAG: hypothetical protein U9R49_13265, partial [Bacteroidota bacterium]|nr:hypothetical protein [Bacteroidota bacterium]
YAMKRFLFILIGLIALSMASAQFRSFGLVAGAGYTAVDIEEAIGWSPLEEWDHIAVIIKAVAEYELLPTLTLVGEIGENRLYYWEYRYSDGYYSGTRWRSEWTTNIGISFKKLMNNALYLQAGTGVHIFNDGTGTVLGFLLGAGYEWELSDRFVVPLGLRIEPVFANAIPVSFLLHSGIRYNL